MARTPARTSAKPADSPLRKAAKKVAAASKPDKTATPAAAPAKKPRAPRATAPSVAPAKPAKPAKAGADAAPPVAAAVAPAKPAKASKPAKPPKSPKPAKGKAKETRKSMLQEASAMIAQLASDILEDRIVPTIDQIKALAASALGRGEAKGKKPKRKKK